MSTLLKTPTVIVVWADSSLASTLCRTLFDLKQSLPAFTIIGLTRRKNSSLVDQWLDQSLVIEGEALEDHLLNFVEESFRSLIIPTSEDLLIRLKGHEGLASATLGPDQTLARTFADKWLTYQLFKDLELDFCDTVLPSQYSSGLYNELIVKPRKGERSEGLVRNPISLDSFSDDWVIQRMIKGREYTVGVYVFKDKTFKFIALERRFLEGGSVYSLSNTVMKQLSSLLQSFVGGLNISGLPFNLQLFEQGGELLTIEINPRFSSSNWIRNQFGFHDVQWTLQEHLFGIAPTIGIQVTEGHAISLRTDFIL